MVENFDYNFCLVVDNFQSCLFNYSTPKNFSIQDQFWIQFLKKYSKHFFIIFLIGYSVFMKLIFEISEELFCNGFAKKIKIKLHVFFLSGHKGRSSNSDYPTWTYPTYVTHELFYSPTASATATSALTTASTAVTTSASTATTTASTAATSASTAAT